MSVNAALFEMFAPPELKPFVPRILAAVATIEKVAAMPEVQDAIKLAEELAPVLKAYQTKLDAATAAPDRQKGN